MWLQGKILMRLRRLWLLPYHIAGQLFYKARKKLILGSDIFSKWVSMIAIVVNMNRTIRCV
jgi:hypothetical protein